MVLSSCPQAPSVAMASRCAGPREERSLWSAFGHQLPTVARPGLRETPHLCLDPEGLHPPAGAGGRGNPLPALSPRECCRRVGWGSPLRSHRSHQTQGDTQLTSPPPGVPERRPAPRSLLNCLSSSTRRCPVETNANGLCPRPPYTRKYFFKVSDHTLVQTQVRRGHQMTGVCGTLRLGITMIAVCPKRTGREC